MRGEAGQIRETHSPSRASARSLKDDVEFAALPKNNRNVQLAELAKKVNRNKRQGEYIPHRRLLGYGVALDQVKALFRLSLDGNQVQ